MSANRQAISAVVDTIDSIRQLRLKHERLYRQSKLLHLFGIWSAWYDTVRRTERYGCDEDTICVGGEDVTSDIDLVVWPIGGVRFLAKNKDGRLYANEAHDGPVRYWRFVSPFSIKWMSRRRVR
jgi:hypothetical protein